jgi:hypothetical protein
MVGTVKLGRVRLATAFRLAARHGPFQESAGQGEAGLGEATDDASEGPAI